MSQADALHKFEGFASYYGADFYRLPRNSGRVTLVRQELHVPQSYAFGGEEVVPLMAGQRLRWQVESVSLDSGEPY